MCVPGRHVLCYRSLQARAGLSSQLQSRLAEEWLALTAGNPLETHPKSNSRCRSATRLQQLTTPPPERLVIRDCSEQDRTLRAGSHQSQHPTDIVFVWALWLLPANGLHSDTDGMGLSWSRLLYGLCCAIYSWWLFIYYYFLCWIVIHVPSVCFGYFRCTRDGTQNCTRNLSNLPFRTPITQPAHSR